MLIAPTDSAVRMGLFAVPRDQIVDAHCAGALVSDLLMSDTLVCTVLYQYGFFHYRSIMSYQIINYTIVTNKLGGCTSFQSNTINRRFPEITGKDNLTVFSYSGRVKSPESSTWTYYNLY